MSPVKQIPRRKPIRIFALALSLGCLLTAGLAVGMPVESTIEMANSGGAISFSGAIVVDTCEAPNSVATASLPARGACHSGDTRSAYRVESEELGDRPGIRLLQYARETYGKITVVTYDYD